MQIRLRGVKRDAAKVKKDLEAAFNVTPEVFIDDTSDAGGTINATVFYEADEVRDEQTVKNALDVMVRKNDYVFFTVDYRDAPTNETVEG